MSRRFVEQIPTQRPFTARHHNVGAAKKLVGLSTNRESRVEMLRDAGHAALMFSTQPELQADIVIWFRSNLPPGGYGLPPAIK